MGTRKGRSTVEETVKSRTEETHSQEALFGVAMLKLALELKRDSAVPFDRLVTQVTGRMKLDEATFRGFLARQGGLLRTLSKHGGGRS